MMISKIRQWMKGPMCKVYLSQCLSSWGDRMWWFAGGLFMKELDAAKNNSLMLTGVFTLVLSASVLAFGGIVGRWVDRTPRLKAARTALLVQNIMLVLCAITISYMFCDWDRIVDKWNGWLLIFLQTAAISTAAVSCLASVGLTIIVQKDWIIVLANNDLDHLAKINSAFRTIDLTSQTLAPILVGVITQYVSRLATAIFIGCWNIVSVIIEYYLLWVIYKQNPQLAIKLPPKTHSPLCIAKYAEHTICPEATYKRRCVFIQYQFYKFFYDWVLYFQYDFRFAGIALALLYMTVLGFDGITTAYGDTQIDTTPLSISQGLSAVFGVIGVLMFPCLRKIFGLTKVGCIGLLCEVFALTACVYSVWLPGSPYDPSSLHLDWSPPNTTNPDTKASSVVSVATLYGGIIVSRFGLWLTDVTIMQIFQEGAEENKRGVVNGVQDAMNMGMDMLKSILVILFPYPQQFGLLIILSFVFVVMGLLSYCYYQHKRCKVVEEEIEEPITIDDTKHTELQ